MEAFIGYKDLLVKNYRDQGLLVEKKQERGGCGGKKERERASS
jgi:hypothetical protein